MKAAMIGLGKMGANMARRLIQGGHEIIGYNRTDSVTNDLAASDGLIPATSLEELVDKLPSPRILWMMVPAGEPTETMINTLAPLLTRGDILIDGGNSFYKDTLRNGNTLKKKGTSLLRSSPLCAISLADTRSKKIDHIQ